MSRAAALGSLLALLPAAVVTFTARPAAVTPRGAALAAEIPQAIGAWRGADEPLDSASLEHLRSDDYVNRAFVAPGEPTVLLTIVFSRHERKAVHPPEVCLEAQGWELLGSAGTVVEAGETRLDVRALELAKRGRRLDVLTWYVGGGETTTSFARQQWNVAVAPLTGAPSGSALVRLVAETPADAPRERGAQAVRRFAAAALPSLAASLR